MQYAAAVLLIFLYNKCTALQLLFSFITTVPHRSTQPGHPSVSRCNEYQTKGNDTVQLMSKGRYSLCFMAGKTV